MLKKKKYARIFLNRLKNKKINNNNKANKQQDVELNQQTESVKCQFET